MTLSLIVAYDKNKTIGNGDKLPFHLPADLQYFKSVTQDSVVIMGRATFESIVSMRGKPLPNRINIILSTDPSYRINYDNCFVFNSIQDVLNKYKQYSRGKESFVIGGSKTYSQFLPYVTKMYITEIHEEFEGDVHFPDVDMSKWELVSSTKGIKDEKNPYNYYFRIYKKVK